MIYRQLTSHKEILERSRSSEKGVLGFKNSMHIRLNTPLSLYQIRAKAQECTRQKLEGPSIPSFENFLMFYAVPFCVGNKPARIFQGVAWNLVQQVENRKQDA
jgi:hypothetical protein